MISDSKKEAIKQSLKETKQKRKSQSCHVYDVKIVKNKLNTTQKEQITRLFLEAKWFYNYCLDQLNEKKTPLSEIDTKINHVQIKNQLGKYEERWLLYLSSQMKQGIVSEIKTSLKALKTAKEHGLKVGALQYKNYCNSIPLKQKNITYKILSKNKIRVQNFDKSFIVRGLEQFINIPHDLANAKLIRKADGFHIFITCYLPKAPTNPVYDSIIGVDFGIGFDFVLSDGTKFKYKLQETDRLKYLQRKLSTLKKGSKQFNNTKKAIKREYDHMNNIKDDLANKFVNYLKKFKIVVIQDENISGWHKGLFGKAVQHSILGRVKDRLLRLPNVVILSRFLPTSKLCFDCGTLKQDLKLKDRVFCCSCNHKKHDRDVHAAQCMVWMYNNDFIDDSAVKAVKSIKRSTVRNEWSNKLISKTEINLLEAATL